jgi:hypothetical protein
VRESDGRAAAASVDHVALPKEKEN